MRSREGLPPVFINMNSTEPDADPGISQHWHRQGQAILVRLGDADPGNVLAIQILIMETGCKPSMVRHGLRKISAMLFKPLVVTSPAMF